MMATGIRLLFQSQELAYSGYKDGVLANSDTGPLAFPDSAEDFDLGLW